MSDPNLADFRNTKEHTPFFMTSLTGRQWRIFKLKTAASHPKCKGCVSSIAKT